jgi:hypothetical protein
VAIDVLVDHALRYCFLILLDDSGADEVEMAGRLDVAVGAGAIANIFLLEEALLRDRLGALFGPRDRRLPIALAPLMSFRG